MKHPNSAKHSKLWLFMIVLFGISSLHFSFLPSHEGPAIDIDPASKLFQDLQKKKSLSWKLEKTYDPYRGGNSLRTHSHSAVQLKLEANGNFREVRSNKILTGSWSLNKEPASLEISCERINGQRMRRTVAPMSYRLISYTDDFLVLGKVGRHGIVELKFKALKTTERSAAPSLLF